jgi:hypothetical protein
VFWSAIGKCASAEQRRAQLECSNSMSAARDQFGGDSGPSTASPSTPLKATPSKSDRRPIFIQAMWRTGSTYVWKKFREQPRYRAYYEPLHECLVHSQGQVLSLSGPDKQAALRHPPSDNHYFVEYPFTPEGGVEYFQKPFSYQRYCLQETEEDADLRRYVGNLIGYAASKEQTPVLQFNRGLLRAGWLARNFHSVQILVLRNPLDVWKSFTRFEGRPFETYLCTLLGQNQDKSPVSHLPSWLEFPRDVCDTFEQECSSYLPFAAANKELLYPSFFDFYLLSIVHCAQFADCILDLGGITRSSSIRKAATDRLRELGIEINLEDCALPSYPSEAADEESIAYERFGKEFLQRRLPLDISMSTQKFAAHSPLLSDYFRTLLSGFAGRETSAPQAQVVPATNRRNEKHALAVHLFESRAFQAAANLLGASLADAETGELWNDWATAQNACSRPHLAELGFRRALRCEPPDREAVGNLGLLLFGEGKFREALPLLQGAELEATEETRPVLSQFVNRARESLGFCSPQHA